MHTVTVSAALPFPLRAGPNPYEIDSERVTGELTVERVQRERPDERMSLVQIAQTAQRQPVNATHQLLVSLAELPAVKDHDPAQALCSWLNCKRLSLLPPLREWRGAMEQRAVRYSR